MKKKIGSDAMNVTVERDLGVTAINVYGTVAGFLFTIAFLVLLSALIKPLAILLFLTFFTVGLVVSMYEED